MGFIYTKDGRLLDSAFALEQNFKLYFVTYLIKNNAKIENINKKYGQYGFTPLHVASILGKLEVVKFLLENSSDANERDEFGHTPLDVAKNEEIKQFLIKQGIKLDKDGNVLNSKIVNKGQYGKSQFFDIVAESVLQAIKTCSPIKNLPNDKYDEWKEIHLIFDPVKFIEKNTQKNNHFS